MVLGGATARLGPAPPHQQATARNRQWAALVAFEEAAKLGAPVNPRQLIGERIPRPTSAVAARPLDNDEDRCVRNHADAGLVATRRAVMLVLSYAGGTASEAAAVRMGDIDLDSGTVEFSGAAARPGVTARSFRLTTARRILDSDGIEAAARFLGSPSLDSTAAALGYRWGQHDG